MRPTRKRQATDDWPDNEACSAAWQGSRSRAELDDDSFAEKPTQPTSQAAGFLMGPTILDLGFVRID